MAETLIKWREWGTDAFAEATGSGKLLLLDISAVWCHWCHVMDETSYSDPVVAGIINDRFVPVRVDTDRMPDVNERYNMGGWPTTAVLVPSGEVLLGATYVPPEKLKEMLTSIDEFFQKNREGLAERIRELKAKKLLDLEKPEEAPPGEITPNIVSYVLEELDRNFDPVHGGFGNEPKFPVPEAVDLLLTAYKDTDRQGYLEMAEKTLEGMASYGMYDHVMGGFFRYSVTRDWTVPHFEKMLESNAGLIINCLNACRVTGKDGYRDTAKKTLDYVDHWLWSGEGYFCGSQDADEEYYKLPMEERLKRKPPFVDTTMFTNLNARMAYAYLTAWETLRDEMYREKALTSLDFILTRMKGEGGGFYHYYYDGKPHRFGLLTDQSAMLRALLYAYQLTGDKGMLGEALLLSGFMEKAHWDAESGGYFDLTEDPEAVAALGHRAKPLGENAEMSGSLKTLYILIGDNRYLDMAGKCLMPHARSYREFSYMASVYALAADFFLKPVLEVTVVGDTGGKDTAALLGSVHGTFVPRRVLRLLDYARDKEEVGRRGFHLSGKAAAYLCRDFACTGRIEEPDELRGRLRM